ncbi:Beta-ketoacyl synthase [Parvibaculum lavamentivorans DS-1]|uniref:Beta-ketoacyl synthase n=1 Tax=Parvibaculum lavamentivorans (strain DS-1 / DSM 13023 / NCIMB 13966) TaxID=402881 RepID=A7HT85_PARL1|nr:beta-ketoacyl-ACP synthase [Parvibaculum lavamentivorans]ABS63118.1 Beta-ketoacyl synthase [Parvibaculum lavamentivorans DS-1]
MNAPVYIAASSVANALGADWAQVSDALFAGDPSGLAQTETLSDGRTPPVGRLRFPLADLPPALAEWESRNNRLIHHCLLPLLPAIHEALSAYGPSRVGIVIGTSTSGIESWEHALARKMTGGVWPNDFHFRRHELGDPAAFVQAVTGAGGPCYGVSTACTSGGKAIVSAARLLQAGLCDAVITGGVDTLCGLTLNGFSVLDSISSARCNPFSTNRDGINIGDGGALFLLTREENDVRIAGWGESSDAHHLSAPDPEGGGAALAIGQALGHAGIEAADIAYLNLHGTATRLNDAMEAQVTQRIFGDDLPCSSTKALTGHMLGAAGSCEAAFVSMALSRGEAPPHLWDGEADPALPVLHLTDRPGERVEGRYMMSCSYAFGGNNLALILARA